MDKKQCQTLFTLALLGQAIAADQTPTITIRLAEPTDIPGLVTVDKAVSVEFFEPLYAHYEFCKRPRYCLEQELAGDIALFKKVIGKTEAQTKVVVAHDSKENRIVGFIVIERTGAHEAEIELLLVAKEFRAQHVGKRLVHEGLKLFDGIAVCNVYPFRFHNDATLKFYEKIGFKNMGLGPAHRLTPYGASYQELFFHYQYIDRVQFRRTVRFFYD